MKKLMWFISLIPLAVTALVMQLLPEKIPMHYDLEGNIDRWGSRTEILIFPVVILLITLFWTLLIRWFEKRSVNAATDKEKTEAALNGRIFIITGICQAVMFSVMHFFSMYSSYVEAVKGMDKAKINISNVSCVLLGIMFIVLGNFIPKAKKNGLLGIRTGWSMYNDNTWRKSNFFGGVTMVIAGILTIITSVVADGGLSTILLLVYIVSVVIISTVYSKKVYDREKESLK